MFGSASRFFNVGPTISLPIFDGGRLRADLDSRDADYDLAVAQYNKSLVKALGDVSDTSTSCVTSAGKSPRNNTPPTLPRTLTTPWSSGTVSGIGNYLDVLSIEQQLLQAQRQLANLNAEQIDLSIQLMQALGGGLHPTTCVCQHIASHAEPLIQGICHGHCRYNSNC
jgi:outer membrane protein TolC